MKKAFTVPWGSESVCSWCKKNGKCELWTEDKEFKILLYGVPIRIHFKDLRLVSALQGCPIDEFEPDNSKIPEQFKEEYDRIKIR